MQLPDEAITYHYQGLVAAAPEEWGPAAELRAEHLVSQADLRDLGSRLADVRSQVVAERELLNPPPEMTPHQPGFIDLPQKQLDDYRKHGAASVVGRVLTQATRLRDDIDRVVILGAGGFPLGARCLFQALRPLYHNEMPPESRLGVPRFYFEGNSFDSDALQDLLDLLQTTCVEPELQGERWAVLVSCPRGALETLLAYRALRREAVEYYGHHWERLRQLLIPIIEPAGPLRNLSLADGYAEDELLTLPDNVGDRFAVFSPVGLLPAAIMGLDIRALLLGAAAMTRRFLEEPFERNPVLQYAGLNHLLSTQHHKPLRVLAVWSKKLEALGHWHDQLLAESLGKQGQGPTPLTMVQTRDLPTRGQQHQDGQRDRVINNVVIKSSKIDPPNVGMADRNQDNLNQYSRKTWADFQDAAQRGTSQSYAAVGRPTADVVLPSLSEHSLGQLMQMLMLATLVEARLLGVNPYGQPGAETYKRYMLTALKERKQEA
jgi:glucose-6-phosphate isomerase